jgi:hypothetical protein
MTLGPGSDLTIDNFVYDPETKAGKLAMTAAVGVFRFVGGRASKDEPVIINTPTATVGIRGGIIRGSTSSTQTAVIMDHGRELSVRSNTTNDTTSTPKSGFTVTSTGSGLSVSKGDNTNTAGAFAGRAGSSGGSTTAPNETSPSARNVASGNSNQLPSAFAPGGITLGANVLAPVNGFAGQLVSQASQTIATGNAGTVFPTNLPGYNVGVVGFQTAFSPGIPITGPFDSTFASIPPFTLTFTSSSSSGGMVTTTTSNITESNTTTVAFGANGAPLTITSSSSSTGTSTSSCSGSCSGFMPFTSTFSNTTSLTANIANASVTELGGDSLIRFGRLNGGQLSVTSSTTFSSGSGSPFVNNQTSTVANQSLPFIISVPATLLPTNAQFNYSFLGGTLPVFFNGSGSPGTFAGSMSILFTSSPVGFSGATTSAGVPGLVVGLVGSVTMPGDAVYPFQTLGGTGNPGAQIGAASGSNVLFGFGPQFSGFLSLVSNGKACSGASSCGISIAGILAGTAAARAGIAYVIGSNSSSGFGPNSIIGVAAFKKN